MTSNKGLTAKQISVMNNKHDRQEAAAAFVRAYKLPKEQREMLQDEILKQIDLWLIHMNTLPHTR